MTVVKQKQNEFVQKTSCMLEIINQKQLPQLFAKFKQVAADVMKVTDVAFLIMDQELKY